jgi:putative ABC transport system permease protein
MIRNYFITAFRYIIRNKVQSVIQIVSLTTGITAILLIGLYVVHEHSYDRFNEKIDRIYRLEIGQRVGLATAFGHQIKENIPEVEDVVRACTYGGEVLLKRQIEDGAKLTRETELKAHYLICDSTFFNVFTFNLIQGDPATALKDPYSIVLTESTARGIFGNEDPIGEELIVEGMTNHKEYKVTGVLRDIENFHINCDALLSMVSLREWASVLYSGEEKWLDSYWSGDDYYTYILLPDQQEPTRSVRIINAFFKDKFDELAYSYQDTFSMRPLRDIYFSSPLKNEHGYCRHGNIKLLRALLAIAVFILILAGINYVNLTTAKSSLRAREVGIRKVSGATRSRLMIQFLAESVLTGLISLLVSYTLVQVLLPTFNQMVQAEFSLKQLFKPEIIGLSVTGVILLGFMAGLYPAIQLTAFHPVASLKEELLRGPRSGIFRRILLALQFVISVVLTMGVLTILKQIHFMKYTDLGFDKELVLSMSHMGMNRDYQMRQVFKERMLKNPNIKKVAFGPIPGAKEETFSSGFDHDGIRIKPNYLSIDPDYLDLLEVELLQGRSFSWDRIGDYFKNVFDFIENPFDAPPMRIIINETAMRELDLESPVGTLLKAENGMTFEIIGVIEDFHFMSLHQKIAPYFYIWWELLGGIHLKISPYNIQETINFIRQEIKAMLPEEDFDYSFLSDTYDLQYANDERMARLISIFAVVAMIIGCLGLFGLSTFMAVRRTKEIGIRKSMGASVRSVFLLLSREFVIWIALSVMVACPVAWIIMNRWLQSFAYRTNMGVWIFVIAILIAFAIAFLTVAWQSLKTARTNPVEALRYE